MLKKYFRCISSLTVAVLLLVAATSGQATPVTLTYTPTPVNLNNLDHHLAYTWRIDNINLGGATITGASLTFANIANWDATANTLFVHLFDTVKYSGVATFIDATGAPVPASQIHDNFASPYLNTTDSSSPFYNPLITPGAGNTFLFSRSFTMTPTTYVFNFTAAELVILQNYIINGKNIGFGFDPDCHYFNDGITFRITTSVPETGSSLALLGLALTAIGVVGHRFRVH